MREWLFLIITRIYVSALYLLNEIYSLRYYASSFSFFKVNLSFFLIYFFKNPFKISQQHLRKRGEKNIYAYGETPLFAMEKIFKEVDISSNDHYVELGCGRGKGCFWVALIKKLSSLGIDFVPEFIEKANHIKEKYGVDLAFFQCEDLYLASNLKGSIFYLYGTGFDENLLNTMAKHLNKLPSKTKIITVSYPLSDYANPGVFFVRKIFPVRFFWGVANVYIQEVL